MNYWSYRIHKAGYNDGSPVFVAEYVAETGPDSVRKDLLNHHSRLKDYLNHFGIKAEEFAKEHAIRTEALLGSLAALSDCSFRLGIWLPVEAPPAHNSERPPGDPLESLFGSVFGVQLWLIKRANE